MRVLFAASEAYPLAKTGGLADVVGSLAAALGELDVETRIIMPGYPSALKHMQRARVKADFGDLFGFGPTTLLAGTMPNSPVGVYLVRNAELFERTGSPYADAAGADWPDNARRFTLLCRVAAALATEHSPLNWHPDLVHAHDWQTALVPALLATRRGGRPPTVFSIHNVAFQGIFPAPVFPELGLPQSAFSVDGVEFYGSVSLLKAGLVYADRLTTVSPTYAREIQEPRFGMGLDGVFAARSADLTGIVNGIDERLWDPTRDPHIPAHYSVEHLEGKRACKAALQQELGLREEATVPLIAMIGRMTEQKGQDLVLGIAPWLLARGVQLAVLGSGDRALESAFVTLAKDHRGSVATRIGYDEPLAHRLEAGADLFLMPSRFEPCGLNQMYSQRYGTPPIVHAVGGLADTVTDAGAQAIASGQASGFAFTEPTQEALLAAIMRALTLLRNAQTWQRIQAAGMRRDFGWHRSAARYRRLYAELGGYRS
ncbi:MAG: glycogen synthase GlgA [Vulcanimicrobiaceae bacterium]